MLCHWDSGDEFVIAAEDSLSSLKQRNKQKIPNHGEMKKTIHVIYKSCVTLHFSKRNLCAYQDIACYDIS